MSEQAIFQSIEEEILRNLKARHQRNNGTINMNDIVNEASYCLAVNNLSSVKQLNAQTGSNLKSLPAESMSLLFTGMDRALEKNLKSDFKTDHSRMIKERYENILTNSNPKELINNHYNGLFGSQGGNVI
jgi:hypothetical protein